MSLNIKNRIVERLARQVANATGATVTEAIHKALVERLERLGIQPDEEVIHHVEETIRAMHDGHKPVTENEEGWDILVE